MARLLLMRHAKSDWDHPDLADVDRPLNQRGHRTAAEMGGWLRSQNILPQLILVSPACRAQETVGRLLTGLGSPHPQVRTVDGLYPGTPATVLQALGSVSAATETLLLVAHNPTMEIVVDMIGGKAEHFPTAAIADIEIPERPWSAALTDSVRFFGHCQLRQIWRPRALFEDIDTKKR
ncbi:MAG: histidine phosphatase family protein [Planctomycetaceae bacterium]|nr:histidine phosphatase family protein [Planctomycetaceae bacterium]